MSRSTKQPVIKNDNHKGNTYGKKLASKAVRRYPQCIANGKMYKKVFESYDVCDNRFNGFSVKDDKQIEKARRK